LGASKQAELRASDSECGGSEDMAASAGDALVHLRSPVVVGCFTRGFELCLELCVELLFNYRDNDC
jgi:hypothetical protein